MFQWGDFALVVTLAIDTIRAHGSPRLQLMRDSHDFSARTHFKTTRSSLRKGLGAAAPWVLPKGNFKSRQPSVFPIAVLRIPSLHIEITTAAESIVEIAQVVVRYPISMIVGMTSGLRRRLDAPNGGQRVRLNTRTKNFKREGLVQREITIPLVAASQDEKAIPLVFDILYFRHLFCFGKWSPTADLFPFLSPPMGDPLFQDAFVVV